MSIPIVSIRDVREAEAVIREHVSPAPLIRSYALEKELGLLPSRRVWLKDYGWTPSGSFKLLGGLNWMANNLERIGSRPVAAHSSGIHGSHHIMTKSGLAVPVPVHGSRDLGAGLLAALRRQTGVELK